MSKSVLNRIPDEHAEVLVTPAAYASSAIHDTYSWLRANQPLGIAHPEGFHPFWVVTKFKDVMSLSLDNKKVPYGDRSSTLVDIASDERTREITGTPFISKTLVQMDEPEHTKYRRLAHSWFLPSSLKQRDAQIRSIAKRTVDHMASLNGRADFVTDVSLHYPLEVILSILGLPADDFPLMLKLTQEILAPQDPDTARTLAELSPTQYADTMFAVLQEFREYFDEITADRRKNPRDDLASVLANGTIDDQPMGDAETFGYYSIIATAGHDTTSSSISTAMWALATQEGLLERLKSDMGLLTPFVNESIRWASPVKNFMRSPSEDVSLRGKEIKKNDWLMLCYASANRDEEAFESPYIFDIDRKKNRHAAFGFGPHVCLGQHMAMMEMKALFEEMLPRLEAVTLAGDPRHTESYFVGGLKNLPVEFSMR